MGGKKKDVLRPQTLALVEADKVVPKSPRKKSSGMEKKSIVGEEKVSGAGMKSRKARIDYAVRDSEVAKIRDGVEVAS